jgi:hypothetical protein
MANLENVLLWVEGLESGEYPQTSGALAKYLDGTFTAKAFCCLGVACEVAHKHGVAMQTQRNGALVSYDGAISAMPSAVLRWLDIEDGNPDLDGNRAIARNDAYGETFPTIAAAIRKEYGLPPREQSER